jgi:hypothetical protein
MAMWKDIVALVATMLVCNLYGAGLRRPFGSLPRIPDVPRRLWDADRLVLRADVVFGAFIITMLIYLFTQMNIFVFLAVWSCSNFLAELLTYKIRLLPSFYVSILLALLAISLVAPPKWMTPVTEISAVVAEPVAR